MIPPLILVYIFIKPQTISPIQKTCKTGTFYSIQVTSIEAILSKYLETLLIPYHRFRHNNNYLMHLKTEESGPFPQNKNSQSVTQASNALPTNQFSSNCSFLDDYACVQEATDILNEEFNKNLMKNRKEEPSLVDYVDQFLWNSPQSEETPMLHIDHASPSTLLQREKINPPLQPSPLPIDQTPKIKPSTKAPKRSRKIESEQLSKDYKKNLAGYIIKKVIRIILLPCFGDRLLKLCQKCSVDVAAIRSLLESCLPGIFGPNSIHSLFAIRCESERKMKEMLLALVQRMLRKQYTLEILREGRMRDFNSYIGVKNRNLLYFSQLLGD